MVFVLTIHHDKYPKFRQMVLYAVDYLYPDSSNGRLGKILNKRSVFTAISAFKVISMMLFGGFLFLVYPIILFYTTGKYPVLVPLNLPGFDPETDFGYMVNTAHMLTLVAVGQTGIYAIEISFSLMINTFWVCADIIKYNIEILKGWSKQRDGFTVYKRKAAIVNVARCLQDLNR